MDSTLRRHDRQIAEIEALEILQKGEYGILSMCSPSNVGYGANNNEIFRRLYGRRKGIHKKVFRQGKSH